MTPEEFQNLIRSDLSNTEICDLTVFGSEAWIMKENFPVGHVEKYASFRTYIGGLFDVSPRNICLVGSSKMGFSMKPNANYRGFDPDESDVDLVIVSTPLFERFWTILLKAQYSWSTRLWPGHKLNVFRRFVSFKPFVEEGIDEINEWNIRMGDIQRDTYVKYQISNTLNYRIYRDWEAVNDYHCNGVEILRRNYVSE